MDFMFQSDESIPPAVSSLRPGQAYLQSWISTSGLIAFEREQHSE